MLPKVKAVIFDLDGTLWNASETSAIGFNRGLKLLGSEQVISKEEVEAVAGKPYRECLEILIKSFDVDMDRIEDVLNREEESAVKEFGGILYDGVEELLNKLNGKVGLYIISNCQEEYLELFLDRYKLRDYFIGYDCHGMSNRPKDQMIRDMIDLYKLEDVIYVGDTEGDKLSSQLAGIPFVHALYGFNKSLKAEYYITSPLDLECIIK